MIKWINERPRPIQLLFVVISTISVAIIVDCYFQWPVVKGIFCPERASVADVRFWSALIYAITLVMGLPVAFLLWHWRDRNVQDQIENARKDVNLKEFQEVQLRAAGALDEKLPIEAREQLQIAALHQLLGFLRGEYGDSFRRPAFELLWPSVGISKERVPSFREWQYEEGDHREYQDYSVFTDSCHKKLDQVALTRISILREAWRDYFHSGFELTGRDFSFIHLPRGADLSELRLTECRFIRAGLERVKFDGANCSFAVLDRIFGQGASFTGANLDFAALNYSGLTGGNFGGAKMQCIFVDNTSMGGAKLHGAKINATSHRDWNLSGASFDDDTEFTSPWFADVQNDQGHSKLKELGAVGVTE